MLFRVEAIRNTTKSLGDVLLVRPVSFTVLVAMFTGIAVGIGLFLVCFSYTKKVEISGVLLPRHGLMRVVAEQSGVVAERGVAEGDTVQTGELLLIINNKRTTATDSDVQGKVLALLAERRGSYHVERAQIRQQASERTASLLGKIHNLTALVTQIDGQIALQAKRVQLDEAIFAVFKEKLEPVRYVSSLDLQQRQAALLDQQLRLAELNRQRVSAVQENQLAETELRYQKIQIARDEETEARNLSSIEQELTESRARREERVLAPGKGVASVISVEPGQAVAAGQTLLTIVPANSELEAELYAPTRAVGFLRPGMRVQLRYQAYSYQHFGLASGTIKDISGAALRPEEINSFFQGAASADHGEPLYRIRVHIDRQTMQGDGTEWPLRAGSLLDASVLLERRRLIEWMFSPILFHTRRS